MRIVTFILVCLMSMATSGAERSVVKLTSMITTDEAKSLLPYSFNIGQMFYDHIGVLLLKDKIVYFDWDHEEVINEIYVLKNKGFSMVPMSLTVKQNIYACVYLNPGIGRYRIGLFENNTNRLIKRTGIHTPSNGTRVAFLQNGRKLLAVGPFMSQYEQMLDRYDENTLSPSEASKAKFDEYFRNNQAYVLWKYDEKLRIIDSTDAIERSGDDLTEFLRLYMNQVFDTDKESNIYIIHSAKNYLFRTYSPNLQLLKEFTGKNDNYKPIPEGLVKGDAHRLKATSGNYSIFYALYKINDLLVSSFYQNTVDMDPPEGSYYYDIHSLEGEKISSGSSPYPFFGHDKEGFIYLYVKKASESWRQKTEYYLVKISIDELLAGEISKKFVLDRIELNSYQ